MKKYKYAQNVFDIIFMYVKISYLCLKNKKKILMIIFEKGGNPSFFV